MGRYRILIKPSAVAEIEALPRKVRVQVIRRIRALGTTPRPAGCEKLTGGTRYRVRQGEHRILYSVDDDESVLLVVKVGHRSEVYRR